MSSPKCHDFDEFYVISDLHMGGRSGSQIFLHGSLLGRFIDFLRSKEAARRIGLCINGDTVDFLAEPNARYFDPDRATAKLDAIFTDATFAPVWMALRAFVGTPNRRLVLTLGNHDLELALPWVREHMVQYLAQDRDDARGRITLSLDGAGYRCEVGGDSVLCLHGNEFDAWNLTDYERLRRIGRDSTQGRQLDTWVPNAGTKLVIEAMNVVKSEFAFVDLLKPEVEAVLPILWVLGQATRSRITAAADVGRRLSWDVVRKRFGFLSPGETSVPSSEGLDELPPIPVYGAVSNDSEAEIDRLLDWAEEQLDAGTEPLSLVESGTDQLGLPGAIWNRIRGRTRVEQAWEAVRELETDTSFALDYQDSIYRRADQFVDQSLRYLITGHTHQARRLNRQRGGGTYFNSGSWAGLMHLTPQQLRSAELFEPVLQALSTSKTLADLERHQLVEWRPTVVSLVKTASGAKGMLTVFKITNDSPALVELP